MTGREELYLFRENVQELVSDSRSPSITDANLVEDKWQSSPTSLATFRAKHRMGAEYIEFRGQYL